MTPHNRLRKSVRTYRAMLERLPLAGLSVRTPAFQDCADYLRELYREFGRDNVRRSFDEEVRS